jgi:hypothetical protein
MARHDESFLREKTHKGQTETTYQRVFYTLHGEGESRTGEAARVTRAVALLIGALQDSGVIRAGDVDDILAKVVD